MEEVISKATIRRSAKNRTTSSVNCMFEARRRNLEGEIHPRD